MAEKSQSAEIQALIRRSATARRELKTAYATLRHKLDVPARVKGSLRAHPMSWFGGSLATGVLASFLVPKGNHRKPAPEVPDKPQRAGLGGFAVTAVASMAKPLLKVWLNGRLRGLTGGFQQALTRRLYTPGRNR